MLVDDKRPRQYKDVVGHSITVNTLKTYTKENKEFPQVMMMSGESGTGKSVLGNIVAMSLTCENPIKTRAGYKEPCLECSSCQDIISERYSMDVVYKNASMMSKDDVNNLEHEVSMGASYGDNKVVIIEEAQELGSKGAKGSLLKILEKKRKGIYFILLTMNESVFDKALVDRCQVYKFKKLNTKEISDYLMSILEELDPKEELFPDTFIDVITAIADNSDGSMRKSLQMFQRCLDGNIFTEESLIEELEITTEEKLEGFIKHLLEGNISALFDLSKSDSLANIFNKLWKMMIQWKRNFMTNIYFSESERLKCEFFAKNRNFNSLLDIFIEISRDNVKYFDNNVFYYHILKYIDSLKPIEIATTEVKSSRRKLKGDN